MGGRLRARDVIRAALRTYRERFGRVAGTAFVVFGAVAVVDAIATILVIDHVSSPVGDAIASTAAAVFVMAGVVVYAGILDKVVGAHLHGHPDLSIREVWSVLPLGRLGAADVLLALATLVGLALFVIPGVTDNIEVVQAQQLLAAANDRYIDSLNAHNAAKIALATAVGVAEEGVPQYLNLKP